MLAIIAEPDDWSDLAPLVEAARLPDVTWLGGMTDAIEELLFSPFRAVVVAYASLASRGIKEMEMAISVLDKAAPKVIVVLGGDQLQEQVPLRAMTGWNLFWLPPWDRAQIWDLLESEPPDDGYDPAEEVAAESDEVDAVDEELALTQIQLSDEFHRIKRSDPYGVFGLEPGCTVEDLDLKFVKMVREYHPDNYNHFRDREVKQTAEKILVQLRRSRASLKDRLDSLGPPIDEPEQPVDESSVPTARMGSASGSPYADLGAKAAKRSPRERQASLERLQRLAKQASMPQAPKVVNEVGEATARLASVHGGFIVDSKGERKLVSAEQLVRNAKAALESGAYEKAWEMLTASAVSTSRVDAKAYLPYAAFLSGKCTAEEAESELNELLSLNPVDGELSTIKCVLGHLFRVSQDHNRARAAFQESVRADPANAEAISWTRHYQTRPHRVAKRSGTGLTNQSSDSSLFKRLFKGRG